MKRCSRCRTEKPLDGFARNRSTPDGLSDWCRDCKREWKHNRPPEVKRAARLRWREANREKYLAQKALQKAVVRGTLVRPESCGDCGALGEIHGHHPDYDRRFDVEWLCIQCHADRHREAA